MSLIEFTPSPKLAALLSSQKRPAPDANWAPKEWHIPYTVGQAWSHGSGMCKHERQPLTKKPATQSLGIYRKCLRNLHQSEHTCAGIETRHTPPIICPPQNGNCMYMDEHVRLRWMGHTASQMGENTHIQLETQRMG